MAYGYYAAITIDNTEVGGTANITDWPVLVKGTFNGTGTEPDLRVTGSGGHIENVDETATADGASDAPADFACYDDDSMTTEYDFEIASYDKTTGAIEFWVRIPTLDYDNDTIFYIHYGDSGVTTSQETITTVWTTKGFVSVYHGENVYDSCGNNNLTSTGVTYATAKVGKGFIFDSDTDGLAKASPSGLTSVTRLGILAWTQIADLNFDSGSLIAGRWGTTVANQQFICQILQDSDSNKFRLYGRSGTSALNVMSDAAIGIDNEVMFIAAKIDFSSTTAGTFDIWKNGASVNNTRTAGTGTLNDSTYDLEIGYRAVQDANAIDDGYLDEEMIFTFDITTGMVLTMYNNMNDPSSFYTMGEEQGGADTIALTGTITTAVESDIVDGGKTILLAITGDTWVADDGTFDGQRQNIIDGLDSAQSEGAGWDAEVKAKMNVSEVVRTSDTVVTITLLAQAGYVITANETITATIPSTALTGGVEIVASPTFTITNETGVTARLRSLMGIGL